MPIFGRWLGQVPAAQVYLTADKAIGGLGTFSISWDTALVNVGDVWDSGAATKLTAPLTGIYVVSAMANDYTSSTYQSGIYIEKNGSGSKIAGTSYGYSVARTSTSQTMMYVTPQLIELEAGDYIKIKAENVVDPVNLSEEATTASMYYLGRS